MWVLIICLISGANRSSSLPLSSPHPMGQTRGLTWEVTVHHALFSSTTALEILAHHLSSTALLPVTIMELPSTAHLAPGGGIWHSATAGITKADGNSIVLLIWTAYLSCEIRTITVIIWVKICHKSQLSSSAIASTRLRHDRMPRRNASLLGLQNCNAPPKLLH